MLHPGTLRARIGKFPLFPLSAFPAHSRSDVQAATGSTRNANRRSV